MGGELWLTETAFTDGTLDLGGADVGQLHAEPETLPGRLRLNGLTYTSLQPYLPALQRLEILGRDIDGYQPQPYEQLAAHCRALGYDEQARTVLLAKQRRRREALTAASKAWGYLQDAAIGYGYRPARALIWLIVLVGLAAAYFTAYPPHATSGSSHAQFQPIIYAFYAVVPILNIGPAQPLPSQRDRAIDRLDRPTGWMDIGQHRRSRRNKSGLPQLKRNWQAVDINSRSRRPLTHAGQRKR